MATQKTYNLRQRKKTTNHEHEPPPSQPPQKSAQVKESKPSEPQKSAPAKESKANPNEIDYCQRLSKAIGDLLISSRNEMFREECFKILDVQNGSDAGTKTRELAMKLKDKRQNVGRRVKRKLDM